jgi:hypothetical protein
MQGSSVSSVLEIQHPDGVAFLVNETRAMTLAPFFEEAITVNEAAKLLGVPLHSIYRKVQEAQKLGLLEVVRSEHRKGRSSKLYQTTAQTFFIPAQHVPLELAIETELMRFQQRWVDNLVAFALTMTDQRGIGLQISCEDKRVKVAPSLGKHEWTMLGDLEPILVEEMAQLDLTLEDAKALQRDLARLWAEYGAKSVQGIKSTQQQKAYLFRLGLIEAVR